MNAIGDDGRVPSGTCYPGSMTRGYYVYALKDPTQNPASIFYVGKGTGARSEQHLHDAANPSANDRIQKIREAGLEPVVVHLVEDLSETDAYRVEAELIAAFGTQATGGRLTNNATPSGLRAANSRHLNVPEGAIELAQGGRRLLMKAVLETVRANPQGIRNSDIASHLGLRSDNAGKQKDYLTYSILGLLMREGAVTKSGGGSLYSASDSYRNDH